eukprot:Gb_37831 [translate_table: standard]
METVCLSTIISSSVPLRKHHLHSGNQRRIQWKKMEISTWGMPILKARKYGLLWVPQLGCRRNKEEGFSGCYSASANVMLNGMDGSLEDSPKNAERTKSLSSPIADPEEASNNDVSNSEDEGDKWDSRESLEDTKGESADEVLRTWVGGSDMEEMHHYSSKPNIAPSSSSSIEFNNQGDENESEMFSKGLKFGNVYGGSPDASFSRSENVWPAANESGKNGDEGEFVVSNAKVSPSDAGDGNVDSDRATVNGWSESPCDEGSLYVEKMNRSYGDFSEKAAEELQSLEEDIFMGGDEGRSPCDYSRRADLFYKSSRIFSFHKAKGESHE